MNCSNCVNGPDASHDSTYCAIVGHRVYHDTTACRAYTPLAPMQTIPMGGYVAQAPGAPPPPGFALHCGCCGDVMTNGTCPRCQP